MIYIFIFNFFGIWSCLILSTILRCFHGNYAIVCGRPGDHPNGTLQRVFRIMERWQEMSPSAKKRNWLWQFPIWIMFRPGNPKWHDSAITYVIFWFSWIKTNFVLSSFHTKQGQSKELSVMTNTMELYSENTTFENRLCCFLQMFAFMHVLD